jgi:Tfp pilus assembly protein PilF
MDKAEDSRKLTQLGLRAIAACDFETAEACFDRAIGADVENIEAWTGLARCQRERMAFVDAERSCRHALALNPSSVPALVEMSEALENQHRWPETGEVCERALALDPQCAKALANLGVTRGQLGQPEETVELLKRSLKLDPNDMEAWHALGLQHVESDAIERAQEIAAGLRERAPEDFHYLHLEAQIRARLGEDTCAAEHFERAAALARNPEDAHACRAWAFVIREDAENVLREFEQLAALRPDVKRYRTDLGVMQLNARAYKEAAATLREVARNEPYNDRAQWALAIASLHIGDVSTACRAERALRALNAEKATELRRALIPWERRRLHNRGIITLSAWAIGSGAIVGGWPLIAYPVYQTAGGVLFAGYAALVVRLNRAQSRLKQARGSAEADAQS